ncbi:SA1362 family protein [Anaerobacillus sp. MEB173]|uniref:SA1362 family protein n=1 Tax=Anaerobacillus sp. MEB173 TaxID=3383345 RepID=UPI003F9214B3
MSRQSYHPLVLILIGLAGLGLFYRLFSDPVGFLSQILIVAAIVGAIIFIYKRFLAKKFAAPHAHRRPKPKTASRSERFKSNVIPHKRKSTNNFKTSTIKKRKAAHNFTVIEGKKNKTKKKNRALF